MRFKYIYKFIKVTACALLRIMMQTEREEKRSDVASFMKSILLFVGLFDNHFVIRIDCVKYEKSTVSSLSQLMPLFSEAAGNLKVHLCLLCIIGNCKIMLKNHISSAPQIAADCSASGGIHVCFNFDVSSSKIHHLQPSIFKMQIFSSVLFNSIQSLLLTFSLLKLR